MAGIQRNHRDDVMRDDEDSYGFRKLFSSKKRQRQKHHKKSNSQSNPPLHTSSPDQQGKRKILNTPTRDNRTNGSKFGIIGSTPEERKSRRSSQVLDIVFTVQFQLKRLPSNERTRTRQWDESTLLAHFKSFYETAIRHDLNMGMCRAIDSPAIDDEIAYGKKMTEILNDSTLNSFTDERVMKYVHVQNQNFLYDRNTGLVHTRIKIRAGRPVNKDQVRLYSRPIFTDWAQGGGHRIFYDEMQQINQYKIGCFLNVSPSTNYEELASDFSQHVQDYIISERAKHLAAKDKDKWSEFQNVTSEFRIFESRLWSRNKYGKLYEAPVGWIMAGNNSSVMGMRVIQKLQEELQQGTRDGRILERNMDVIPRPDDIRDSTLVDICKTCNDMYVNSIQMEFEDLFGLDETIKTSSGQQKTFRTFLLDMTVSETDPQLLIMHAD